MGEVAATFVPSKSPVKSSILVATIPESTSLSNGRRLGRSRSEAQLPPLHTNCTPATWRVGPWSMKNVMRSKVSRRSRFQVTRASKWPRCCM
jgi:hypothetical protein